MSKIAVVLWALTLIGGLTYSFFRMFSEKRLFKKDRYNPILGKITKEQDTLFLSFLCGTATFLIVVLIVRIILVYFVE